NEVVRDRLQQRRQCGHEFRQVAADDRREPLELVLRVLQALGLFVRELDAEAAILLAELVDAVRSLAQQTEDRRELLTEEDGADPRADSRAGEQSARAEDVGDAPECAALLGEAFGLAVELVDRRGNDLQSAARRLGGFGDAAQRALALLADLRQVRRYLLAA